MKLPSHAASPRRKATLETSQPQSGWSRHRFETRPARDDGNGAHLYSMVPCGTNSPAPAQLRRSAIFSSCGPPPQRNAFTVIELLAVMLCLALFASLIFPEFIKPHKYRSRAYCQNYLKMIGLAFRTWEGDYGDRYPMSVSTNIGGSMEYLAGPGTFHHLSVMSNEINNTTIVVCPTDNRNPAASLGQMNNSNLSYFVGLDADERFPSFVLSGDRNLVTNAIAVNPGLAVIRSNQPVAWSKQIHKLAGNVLLADGSVQQTSTSTVSTLFQQTGTNLTRLAVP